VSFAGRLSDPDVVEIVRSARALIVTSVEEFGIAAVESQAAGRPVIARRAGGVLETVVDGVTGRLWSGGPADLAEAVTNFDDGAIDPAACRRNAARFDVNAFRRGIYNEIRAAADPRPRPPGTERRLLVSTRLVRRAAGVQHR
jgi:glycosyltransferase involved in cell wall biosynthesis